MRRKDSFNSDNQQFNQYQQQKSNNHISP